MSKTLAGGLALAGLGCLWLRVIGRAATVLLTILGIAALLAALVVIVL